MGTEQQVHQAAIRGPRSPVIPALIGAIVGAALTYVLVPAKEPPSPPPVPVAAAPAPVPCTPAPEPAPAPKPVKKSGGLAGLIGKIDPVAAPPERHSSDVDREALGRYIREKLPSIRMCYDRQLKLNPSLKGKIVVRFNVTPAGRVGNGAIESDTMNDDRVGQCILMQMRGWSLPFHPSENTAVSFPFVFQPG